MTKKLFKKEIKKVADFITYWRRIFPYTLYLLLLAYLKNKRTSSKYIRKVFLCEAITSTVESFTNICKIRKSDMRNGYGYSINKAFLDSEGDYIYIIQDKTGYKQDKSRPNYKVSEITAYSYFKQYLLNYLNKWFRHILVSIENGNFKIANEYMMFVGGFKINYINPILDEPLNKIEKYILKQEISLAIKKYDLKVKNERRPFSESMPF